MHALREHAASQPGVTVANPRLILADDHRMFTDALCSHLRNSFDVIGVASNGRELLALLRVHQADCLLLDLNMPDKCGLDLLPSIRRAQPDLRALVVTMMVDRVLADAALAAGARGFIPKDAPISELIAAIKEVLTGRLYVSPRIPKSSHRVSLHAAHLGLHRLTPRQQSIVLLMGEGRSGADIADALGVWPSTITFHKQNILRALGVETDAAILRFAVLVRAAIADNEDSDVGH